MVFSLRIIGSSSAIPTTSRHTAAFVLNVHGQYILIDCGEGTQIQLRSHNIKLQRISHILISHLHGDHYFGLMGLLTTMHLLGRTKTLDLYGPEALKAIIDTQLEVSATVLRYPLHFHPITPGIIEDNGHFSINAFPLKHRITTFGFRIDEQAAPSKINTKNFYFSKIPRDQMPSVKAGKDLVLPDGTKVPSAELLLPPPPPRSFAYCSDTCYLPKLTKYIDGVDLLFHEATFLEDMKDRAQETMHSTAGDAARMAAAAHAGKLLLGHFSARYKSLSGFLDETRALFPESYLAEEGMLFDVPLQNR